ncbi:pentapeptide repeat-containing protein [Bordetella bronchialis]|uniref:Pentapeptide repeat-containing protein n=1 Tax=Bordetella bronchialis TaxID=463025 RepID=A0A193G1G6_9BORD|nr:pentapeptide repeat-containing protein [Bordetella bronchialis]ANN67988.1 hypothetical protein BAU06_18305 [Bordetella bronchialis]ANN73079.1 hypothetical protein BAU08_18530 [Bordetella bronchialis]
MQLSVAHFIPSCIFRSSGDPDTGDRAAREIEKTIKALAKATGLGREGRQALLQWTSWGIYAAALAVRDPHLLAQDGWNAVLPLTHQAGGDRLRLFLLRAGEPPRAAQDAAQAFYRQGLIPTDDDVVMALRDDHRALLQLNAMLREGAWQEWLGRLPATDLPPHAVPFETLPAWARETALFASDMAGKDCSHMRGLNGLDLRYLHAPGINLEGCDLSGTNFHQADLQGARWHNTLIRGAVLPLRR